MNVRSSPVAIFDSGLGGLSVLREVRRALPEESILYVADSRFCPYGDRSPKEIRERTFAIGDAIAKLGSKLLIVACNTACSVALEDLRRRQSIPVVGLEPAIKPAVARSRTGEIAVLVTPRTAASQRLASLVSRYADGVTVHVLAGRGMVELVEAGELSGPGVDATLRSILRPLVGRQVDALVLGCTHYPFLSRAIRSILGPEVHLIDSGAAVANRTRQLLEPSDSGQRRGNDAIRVLTTGNPAEVSRVAGLLLEHPIAADLLEC